MVSREEKRERKNEEKASARLALFPEYEDVRYVNARVAVCGMQRLVVGIQERELVVLEGFDWNATGTTAHKSLVRKCLWIQRI